MRSGLKRFLAVLALAVLPVLAGCEEAPTGTAKVEAPPPSVTVIRVKSEETRPSVAFTGRIQAIDKVDLRARIDGFLEQRLFTEGSDVKKGGRLFVIEKASYEAAVAEAQGAVEAAQATLTRADLEYERQLTLAKKGVAATAKLEDATAVRDEARGNLAQLKAKLTGAQLNLSYTEVTAPIDGRIGRSQFSVGNFIGPASGTLASIVSQDPIHVSFAVSQREILTVRERLGAARSAADTEVLLRLANDTFYKHPGKIDFVDVTVNQGTDTVQIRATFPNPDRVLVDGQLVGAVVQTGAPEAALVIPQAAIQVDQSGTFVLGVTKENKIEVRRVELGAMNGANTIVRAGLAEGDLIVTEGVQKVRPGQVVQPNEIKPGV